MGSILTAWMLVVTTAKTGSELMSTAPPLRGEPLMVRIPALGALSLVKKFGTKGKFTVRSHEPVTGLNPNRPETMLARTQISPLESIVSAIMRPSPLYRRARPEYWGSFQDW